MNYENNLPPLKTAISVCTLPAGCDAKDALIYQDKIIRDYAHEHKYLLIRVIKEVMGEMGYYNRLVEVKKLVKNKEIDVILVQDRLRLSKDTYAYLNFEAFCNFYGVKIIALNDQR